MKKESRKVSCFRFSLIELLIVIAIIAILAGMLLPVLNNVRGKAHEISCVSRLKQMGTAIISYADSSDGWLPFKGSEFYEEYKLGKFLGASISTQGGYVAVNPQSGVSALLVNMCAQISRGIGHNCPSSVIQLAVADTCDLTADLSVYETNMNLLYDGLTQLGFEVVRPGGTFYLFPKALEADAGAFCKKAIEYGLVLVPSDTFGVPGYFRIAFCTDTQKVVRSLEAFRRFVREQYRR